MFSLCEFLGISCVFLKITRVGGVVFFLLRNLQIVLSEAGTSWDEEKAPCNGMRHEPLPWSLTTP